MFEKKGSSPWAAVWKMQLAERQAKQRVEMVEAILEGIKGCPGRRCW